MDRRWERWFENNVNSDSIQTLLQRLRIFYMFENNVNSDSIQTLFINSRRRILFENNVNSDSIQTPAGTMNNYGSLRVV